MTIQKIRTQAEYRATPKEISTLVDEDPELDTPAEERLDALVSLVQAYEAMYVPVDANLVNRLRSVTAAVDVDLDQPPPPEPGDPGMA